MQVADFDGFRYALFFVPTTHRTLFFLLCKDRSEDVFISAVEKFCGSVLKSSGFSVKCFNIFRHDNECRFLSERSRAHFAKLNIGQQATDPYFSASGNPYAEIEIQKNFGMARTIVLSAKLPSRAWGKSANRHSTRKKSIA